MLPSELGALQLPTSEPAPEQSFRLRERAAKLASQQAHTVTLSARWGEGRGEVGHGFQTEG